MVIVLQGFPSVLYFKSSLDPHKNFLRVPGQKSRVLYPEIFKLHIQIKDQNCRNVQSESHFTECFQQIIISIKNLHFLVHFPISF